MKLREKTLLMIIIPVILIFTSIIGESVYLNRDKNGTWSCSTTAGIDNKYKPVYCI